MLALGANASKGRKSSNLFRRTNLNFKRSIMTKNEFIEMIKDDHLCENAHQRMI